MTTVLDQAAVARAYAAAESITKEQARNFYYGIRLLSKDKRSALCAVYALARRVDDIGDGDLPAARKLAELQSLRTQVAGLAADGAGYRWADLVLVAVADASRRFPIPLGAFGELIDGVEMDVRGRGYQTFEDLIEYCRCVAGSIGRLCLGIFGGLSGTAPTGDSVERADVLGIALQQTNILRDIREDLMNGRVYLPAEDLARFGVRLELDPSGRLADEDGRLADLIRFSAERARGWYLDGLRLLPDLDGRSAACCAAMSGIYQQLLAQIETTPSIVFDRRLSLSGWDKARVATRALTGRRALRAGVS